jgi:hypothetical protein
MVRSSAQAIRLPTEQRLVVQPPPEAVRPPRPNNILIASFTDFGRAPRGAHDSARAMHGPDIHDTGHATRGTDVPALSIALVASPSGYKRATGTTPTSVSAADEGRIGGTFDQPSFDDHANEAGLPAIDQQTYLVGHLSIGLVAGALLCLHYPRRSEVAPHHGRRICCLDRQQHLGSCPLPCWLQCHHR